MIIMKKKKKSDKEEEEDDDDDDAIVSSLPVATNENGEYSVSWVVEHDEAPSGTYMLKFYREIDRKRALENKEFTEKRKKREDELKILEGEEDEEKKEEKKKEVVVEVDEEDELQPLFVIRLAHEGFSTGKLPIRTEIIFLILLAAAFFALSYQKKQYTLK